MKKIVSILILFGFLFNGVMPPAVAEVVFLPPAQGTVSLSPAFTPCQLRGVKIDPRDPFRLDFIVEEGDSGLAGQAFEDESQKLIKYFLATLTTPEKDLWVNLSPYEDNRIIQDDFGRTAMGRDLLSQDYVLKQITASLMHPDADLGKKFWAEVYKRTFEKYGTTDIPVDTFNKVWIVPERAVIYESSNDSMSAFVDNARLRVMLESDYVAQNQSVVMSAKTESFGETSPAKTRFWRGGLESDYLAQNEGRKDERTMDEAGRSSIVRASKASERPSSNGDTQNLAKQVVREVIVPVLEREVNEGKNFAQLRQVYHSLLLAVWLKKKLQSAVPPEPVAEKPGTVKGNLLSMIFVNQHKTGGLETADPKAQVRSIYDRYVEAFKQGAYNIIREDYDIYSQELIPRKYFSGGMNFSLQNLDAAMETRRGAPSALKGDFAMARTRLKSVKPTPNGSENTGVAEIFNEFFTAMLTGKDLRIVYQPGWIRDAVAVTATAVLAGGLWIGGQYVMNELQSDLKDAPLVDVAEDGFQLPQNYSQEEFAAAVDMTSGIVDDVLRAAVTTSDALNKKYGIKAKASKTPLDEVFSSKKLGISIQVLTKTLIESYQLADNFQEAGYSLEDHIRFVLGFMWKESSLVGNAGQELVSQGKKSDRGVLQVSTKEIWDEGLRELRMKSGMRDAFNWSWERDVFDPVKNIRVAAALVNKQLKTEMNELRRIKGDPRYQVFYRQWRGLAKGAKVNAALDSFDMKNLVPILSYVRYNAGNRPTQTRAFILHVVTKGVIADQVWKNAYAAALLTGATFKDDGSKNIGRAEVRRLSKDFKAQLIKESVPGAKPAGAKGRIKISNNRYGMPRGSAVDRAMTSYGGIDLETGQMDLDIRGNAGTFEVEIPADKLEQLRNDVKGFVPLIINIQPVTDVPLFLGLSESSGSST